ncbi:putative membrane protein (TIGR04086 family) [Anaerospora hongkongensis]|uniref:Putative membrane protein (TIGR04086 family) n=1 Tax=Anaerospora hongkongensis TaxID=244830 RepID=A0A4R1PMD4_9FIRM|nr:TIGR04086 family membrane protein [Anaerospora hongkongensis]TCL31790.1 putative membrane protein (TIGR04086 family) [Anaerospora hongkongensis]
MNKISRRLRSNTQPPRSDGTAVLIFKGVITSVAVSVFCILFLSLISLTSDNSFIDAYMQYILVGVSLTSIFIGSAYATQKAQTMGLIIGMTVGIIYVLVSLGIGVELNNDTLSIFVVANKIVAGLAAGALGGLVGVNL